MKVLKEKILDLRYPQKHFQPDEFDLPFIKDNGYNNIIYRSDDDAEKNVYLSDNTLNELRNYPWV